MPTDRRPPCATRPTPFLSSTCRTISVPGGALAVPGGDEIVPGINALMAEFSAVILTQDWHPAGHSSFASQHPGKSPMEMTEMPYGPQVLWPDHCVQGSDGAAFHPDLNTDRADLIIRKGFRPGIDSYSAFFENDHTTPTGLEGYLRTRGISHLTMVGLATDFCVNFSAVDAARLGFTVEVRGDLSRRHRPERLPRCGESRNGGSRRDPSSERTLTYRTPKPARVLHLSKNTPAGGTRRGRGLPKGGARPRRPLSEHRVFAKRSTSASPAIKRA